MIKTKPQERRDDPMKQAYETPKAAKLNYDYTSTVRASAGTPKNKNFSYCTVQNGNGGRVNNNDKCS